MNIHNFVILEKLKKLVSLESLVPMDAIRLVCQDWPAFEERIYTVRDILDVYGNLHDPASKTFVRVQSMR